MKLQSIIESLKQSVQYLEPNLDVEWKEAERYPELAELGLDGWKALKGQQINVTHLGGLKNIQNTEGTDINTAKKAIATLEPEKVRRMQQAIEAGVVELPIIAKFHPWSQSHYFGNAAFHLVAGNTRFTGLVANGILPEVYYIDLTTQLNEIYDQDAFDRVFKNRAPTKLAPGFKYGKLPHKEVLSAIEEWEYGNTPIPLSNGYVINAYEEGASADDNAWILKDPQGNEVESGTGSIVDVMQEFTAQEIKEFLDTNFKDNSPQQPKKGRLVTKDGVDITDQLPYKTVDFRGNPMVIVDFAPPQHEASTGRIYTDNGGSYFPSVADLKIIGHDFSEGTVTTGDCYEANGRAFQDNNSPTARLIHADITPRLGNMAGRTYGHAWIEDGNKLVDHTTVGTNVMALISGFDDLPDNLGVSSKSIFYGIADPKNIKRYDSEALFKMITKHQTWGPWETTSEGTFIQQFEPEYSEKKREIANKLRKKLGLDPKPELDWKIDLANKMQRAEWIEQYKELKKEFNEGDVIDGNFPIQQRLAKVKQRKKEESKQEQILKRFASFWYNNDSIQDQRTVEKKLAELGWDIGEYEGEGGGAQVMRFSDEGEEGDMDSDSFIAWTANDLQGIKEEYPIYKTLDYMNRPSREERQKAYKRRQQELKDKKKAKTEAIQPPRGWISHEAIGMLIRDEMGDMAQEQWDYMELATEPDDLLKYQAREFGSKIGHMAIDMTTEHNKAADIDKVNTLLSKYPKHFHFKVTDIKWVEDKDYPLWNVEPVEILVNSLNLSEYGAMADLSKMWSRPVGSQQHLLKKKKKKKKLKEHETPKYLYHVTFKSNIQNIKAKGLEQFHTSLWIKGPDGQRYNDEAGIFAFDHPLDAIQWAQKMEWEFRDDIIPNADDDITIIRLDMQDGEEIWGDDPSDDMMLTRHGKSLRSRQNISADKIIDTFNMEEFGKAGVLKISRDEWLSQVEQRLVS